MLDEKAGNLKMGSPPKGISDLAHRWQLSNASFLKENQEYTGGSPPPGKYKMLNLTSPREPLPDELCSQCIQTSYLASSCEPLETLSPVLSPVWAPLGGWPGDTRSWEHVFSISHHLLCGCFGQKRPSAGEDFSLVL